MVEEAKNALDINEAAAFLGVHPQTVRKLARKAELPSFKVGRAWRFHREALQNWVDTHHQRHRSPLILVVDDEESIRETVRVSLKAAGYRVHTAAGGAAAIALVNEKVPDAVILDLAMPDVSGVDVLREIRDKAPDLPVVVVTGYPDGDLMQRALKFSPFVVLAKPVALERLKVILRRLCESTGSEVGNSGGAVGGGTNDKRGDQV